MDNSTNEEIEQEQVTEDGLVHSDATDHVPAPWWGTRLYCTTQSTGHALRKVFDAATGMNRLATRNIKLDLEDSFFGSVGMTFAAAGGACGSLTLLVAVGNLIAGRIEIAAEAGAAGVGLLLVMCAALQVTTAFQAGKHDYQLAKSLQSKLPPNSTPKPLSPE
jgi:hypothetical protein